MSQINISEKDLKRLAEAVYQKYNFDFRLYAGPSVKRRIERWLSISPLDDIETLISKIKLGVFTYDDLISKLTVNTTELFRDAEFWKYLKDFLVPTFGESSKIKIWHAGCSSGEEVYSMCIMLDKLGLFDKAEIHASDLDKTILTTAKTGAYNKFRQAEMFKAGYNAVFDDQQFEKNIEPYDSENFKFKDKYRFKPKFFEFDLVKGVNPEKYDIILCRNVLIYFNLTLQDEVISRYKDALNIGSYLMVGSKETIAFTRAAANFETISSTQKVYRKLV